MSCIKKKTHSGASKRFRITSSGKIKRAHACKSHLIGGKKRKRLRGLKKGGYVSKSQLKKIKSII